MISTQYIETDLGAGVMARVTAAPLLLEQLLSRVGRAAVGKSRERLTQ